MKKSLKITLIVLAAILAALLLTYLVWEKTMRMNAANKLLADSKPVPAREIYEDMAVDRPDSPHILHNLGLALHLESQYGRAAENLGKGLENFKKDNINARQSGELFFKSAYHLGSALFKQAEQSLEKDGKANEQTAALYRAALECFKQAVEANPDDIEAKYNYELARLRQQEQDDSQQNEKTRDDKQDPKEDPEDKQGDNQKQDKEDKSQNNETKTNDGKDNQGEENRMNRAEAEALLNMAENADQYQAPIIVDSGAPAGKDW